MPANLPPQYYELERSFKDEKDPSEKLRMAQELLRIMPKHKGTDKLQAEMKAKISLLKKQIEQGGKQHGAKQVLTHDHIEREGAGQVILIGPPNSGKSSLLEILTHAKPLVADYPYSTREPLTGMMTFETIQIQLIDTPPISDEMYEPYMSNLIRNADIVVLVCDASESNPLPRIDYIIDSLAQKHILLRPDLSQPVDDPRFFVKKGLICAHKALEDDSHTGIQELTQRFPGFIIIPTSVLDDSLLQVFKRTLFEALSIIRVYTKHIGKDVELGQLSKKRRFQFTRILRRI
jgi:ribosome-interacting GTPase 1